MSLYQLQPPEPHHRRSPWLITTVLVLVVLLLATALWFFTRGDLGLALMTTPTPSPTPGAPATATADFRATIFAEDQATQAAYYAVVTRQTPVVQFVPVAMAGADSTATAVSLNLPVVGGGGAVSPLGTPTTDPNSSVINLPDVQAPPPEIEVNPDSPLETPTPAGPPAPDVIETETPTPTEIFIETETPTMTAAPTVFLMVPQRAYIDPPLNDTTVGLRMAPMNTHTPDAMLGAGTEVRLLGRDETGEWLYVCCVNDVPRWIRQAYAPPRDNTLPDNAPPSATPNDVRWLPTQPWPGNISQPEAATPIPPEDYPLVRRDRANTGRVPTGFGGSVSPMWSAETPQRITTPVLVHGNFVVAASADGHIYGINRLYGGQEWRKLINAVISQPPVIQDNIIYFADDLGRIAAIPLGSETPAWGLFNLSIPNIATTALPATGFVGAENLLFIGVSHNGNHHIIQIDQARGGVLRAFDIGTIPPQPLVVGHQLLYVAAGAQLWAIDLFDFELVWVRTDLDTIRTPPLYAANGVRATAELYVALFNGSILALDANTGATVYTYDGGGDWTTGLALGDNALYATGNSFVKAYDRHGTTSTHLWRSITSGEARGGAIVTTDQMIVVTASGAIHLVNPNDGILSPTSSMGSNASNAPAVSGPYLYIPGEDGRIHAFTQ